MKSFGLFILGMSPILVCVRLSALILYFFCAFTGIRIAQECVGMEVMPAIQ